ncbi:hypothetical protein Fcan01_24732 [Folsomia candida]|uniref:Uncharacterized protein n=1 Tax=Folsomia candida TaxID=158441 RepID=A0A226D4R5_FOLCA|nr:hypothetical protein Fcan01_24732 [Folsomia candida]
MNFKSCGTLFMFFVACEVLLLCFCCCDGAKIPTSTRPPITPTVDPKTQPGRVTQTFTGNESSWVPGVSAAVIVIIVFLISLFACCIHCPFCIVYKRNASQRII